MKILLLILLFAIPANAQETNSTTNNLQKVPCPMVVGNVQTGTFKYDGELECFTSQKAARMSGYTEKSGCCSKHKGVNRCDKKKKKYVCRDNTYSPTCRCR